MKWKEIRRRLRAVRHKLARVALGITLCDQRIHSHYKKARQARENAQKLRRQGKISRSDKANQRANYHQHKAHANERRKAWLRDKHIYLQLLRRKNLRRKHKWLKNHPEPPPSAGGFVTFDGKPTARWIADVLQDARDAGAWHGYQISGYRSTALCIALCQAICGQDSCSGTCGGPTSNHTCPPTHTGVPHEGATDCTDAGNLRAYAQSHGIPLYNHLPLDYPHSSASGY